MTRFSRDNRGIEKFFGLDARRTCRPKVARRRRSLGLEFRSAIYQPLEDRIMLDIGGANPPTIVVGRELSAYDVPDIQNNQETLTLTVYNQTVDPISGVLLTDTLKPGVTFASASQLPDQNGQQFAWSLGTIQPFERATVTLTVSLANPTPTTLDTGASAYGTLDAGLVSWTTAPATLRTTAIAANLLASTPDANTTDPFIQEKAAELNYDPTQIYSFLQNDIGYNSYAGSLRGARGTLWSSAGNSLDDASLGVALMRASGIPAQYEEGTLTTAQAQQLILSMFPASYQAVGYIPAGTQTTDPANDPKLLSETKDHYWFQFDAGSGMKDADAQFGGQTIGQKATTASNSFTEVPDALRAKTEIKLTAEIYGQAAALFGISDGLSENVVLDQTFNDVDLVGHPLTIGNFVNSSGIGAIFTSITNTYSPYIAIGDDANPDPRQDPIIRGTDYQEVLTNFPFSAQVLTGLFLNVTTSGPGEAQETAEHTLVDRIGYAARQGLVPTSVSVSPDSTPALSDGDVLTLDIATSSQPQGPLVALGSQAASDSAALNAAAAAAGPSSGIPSSLSVLQRAVSTENTELIAGYFGLESDSARARTSAIGLSSVYLDSPRVAAVSEVAKFDSVSNLATTSLDMDIMRDEPRAVASPGQSASAVTAALEVQGIDDSIIESAVLPPSNAASGIVTTSSFGIFTQALSQPGAAVLEISAGNLQALSSLGFSPEVNSRITAAVSSGDTVLVPSQAVEINGQKRVAWIQMNQAGNTIAVSDNGEHNIASTGGAYGASEQPKKSLFVQIYLRRLAAARAAAAAQAIPSFRQAEVNLFNNVVSRVNEFNSLRPWGEQDPPLGDQVFGVLAAGAATTSSSTASIVTSAGIGGGSVTATTSASAVSVSGSLAASWTSAAVSAFATTGLTAASATVSSGSGQGIGSGPVALSATSPINVAVSGSNQYQVTGKGRLSLYGPAENTLGVSGDWVNYSATINGNDSFNLTVPAGALTLNGQPLPAGTYKIATSSATLSGSGSTASPNFAGTVSITATGGTVELGPGSGSLSVGGTAVATANETTLTGYSGTVNVAANGNGTDAVTLNGNAGNVLTIAPSATALTTNQNTPVSFNATVQTSFADTYKLTANAPIGWTVTIDHTGKVTVTPAPGTQSGTYPVQLIAQSTTNPALVSQATVEVTVNATTPGMTLAVTPDTQFTVPFDGAQLPTAFRAAMQNTGPTSDTYKLTFSNVPSGFTILNSRTTVTAPAGQTAIVGLYLQPTGTTLPPPGTNLSFTVTATSTTNQTITQTVNMSFTMPTIDAVTVASNPASVTSTPGTPTTATVTITNVGNVAANAALSATTDSGLTANGLPSTPVSVGIGQSTKETVTLTPAANAALNSTLTATVGAGPAATQDEVSVVSVAAALRGSAAASAVLGTATAGAAVPQSFAPGETVDVTADILAGVTNPRQALASYTVTNSAGTTVFTSVPVTVSLGALPADKKIDLGTFSTTGFAAGQSTIHVAITETGGQAIAGATGTETLVIDSPVTAGLSVDSEQVSPGTNSVTSTLTVADQPVLGGVQTDGTASSVAINGTLAYVAGTKDINVVDISDPSNPQIVGTFGSDKITSGNNTFVAVAGNDLIVGTGVQSSLNGFTVLVYTLSNPKNPQFAGSVNVPYAGMAGITVQGTTAYFPTEGFLYDTSSGSISDQFGDVSAVDFSNPAAPQLLGVLFNDRAAPEGHSGAQWDLQPVASGIAYAAGSMSTGPNTQTGTGQISVINTTNPSNLSVSSTLALPGTVQALAIGVQGNTALVVGSSGGYLSPFGDPSNIQLKGNVTLTLLDISTPSNPKIIGSTVATQNTFAVVGESPVGKIQVVALGNNRFAVNGTLLNGAFTVLTVDATTQNSPAISTFTENAPVSNLALAGGLLLATSANGLQVLQPNTLFTTSVTAEVDVPNTGATINLNSFSTPPTSITQGGTSTALVWKLSLAPGDNHQITWQSTTSDLLPGQVLPVAMGGSAQFTENGTNETITLPALNVVAIEAPQTVQMPLLVRSAQTVAISQASVDANSAGNKQLSTTLSELSDTVSLLQSKPTDTNVLSRTQLLLNNLQPELTADPVLAQTTAQLTPIQTDANKGDVTDMLTAIPPFFTNLDKLLAVEAAEQFTVTVSPNEVDLPALTGQQKSLTVTVTDTGPDPETLNLSTGSLPNNVTAMLGQSQISLQPGASQSVSLTLSSNLVSTKIFTLNVQAADSTDSTLATVVHNGTAVVAVRAAAADVVSVAVNPITVDAGSPVSVSASIFNTANATRNVLAHIQVFNAANVAVLTPPDVPLALMPTTSAVSFNVGTIDTSSLVTGVYTLEVSLHATDGTTLPGKNSEAPFLVGLPISATVSASPTNLPPGTSTVTSTITVSNTTTTTKAPVGDIQAFYDSKQNNFGIGNLDGAAFVIQNTSPLPITNGVFKITPDSGPSDSFKVGTIPAGGQVIIEPGVSDDGQSGHTFFKVTGTLLDESDQGPDSNTTQFEFTALQGTTVIDSGIFTPAATAGPSNDGKASNINFLGGPNDSDVPSFDIFGAKIVATLYDPPGNAAGGGSQGGSYSQSPPSSPQSATPQVDPPTPPTPPAFNPPAGDAVKWIGATSGNWDVAANWLDTTTNSNHVPDATDNVTINASGLTITVETGNQTAQSLLVKSGSTLAVTGGNLFVTRGAEIDGAVTLGNGNNTLAMGGGATITGSMSWTDGGILNLDGGNLFNTGTMTLSGNNFYLDSRGPTGTSNLKGNFYNEGKVIQQSGSLQLFDSVTLNNTSAGTWQFAGDTNIRSQTFTPQVVNSGLFQKTAGTATSSIDSTLSNVGGTLEADSGKLVLTASNNTFTDGVFNAKTGGTLNLTNGANGVTFSGTFTGSGSGTVLLADGTVYLAGDTTFDFAAGLFNWYNNTINLQGHTLTNTGSMSLGVASSGASESIDSTDASNNPLGGTFENNGIVTLQGPDTLYLDDTVVLDNSATGSIQFAGTASGEATVRVGNGSPSLTNEGTLEKTGGSGEAHLSVPFTFTSGAMKVNSGTLVLDPTSAQIAGTSFNVATGATLDLAGNSGGNVFSGTFTGTGGGNVLLEAGSIVVGSAGATFNFPSGMFQWTGGYINLDGHTLTNAGSITLANNNNVSLSANDFFQGKGDGNLGGTLNNTGTIVEQGTGSLGLYDSVAVNNQSGGTYNFASDAVIYVGNYSPSMTNAGTITKSAGTGTSYIGLPFSNTGGTINVASGTLSLQGNGGASTGGTFKVATGGTLLLAGNGTNGNQYTGTYTGTGSGAVEIGNGSIVIGSGGATFNFPAGMLQWTDGGINLNGNTLTNTGVMTVALANANSLYGNSSFPGGANKGGNQGGTLDNQGTINDQGPAAINLYDSVVLKNDTGGTFNLSGGADLIFQNYSSSVVNAGKFTVNDASGTSTISAPLTNTGTLTIVAGELDLTNTVTNIGTLDAGANKLVFPQNSYLDNPGTLQVEGGTARLNGSVKQDSGGTLTGGSWVAAAGGKIQFPANVNISASNATVVISGANSSITPMSTLALNDGALAVTSGATFQVNGNFANDGLLALGGGTSAGAQKPAEKSALAFNGSSDFVSVGNIGARPTQGTISFWMQPTTVSSFQNVLTTGPTNSNGSGGNQAIRFEENGQSLYAAFGNDTASDNGNSGFNYFLLTNSLTPGAWVNVTVTWDSSANTVTGYLNGTQVFSGTNSNFPSNFGNVTFGLGYSSNAGDQRYYHGLLSDVRFYNVARSQTDIQSDMTKLLAGNETGLIGYWPLNDGSGTTAKDLTAGAHNGTLGGGTAADDPTWISTGAALGIAGNFTQAATGTLDLQLGGTPASGNFGQLAASGSATFGGLLHSEFVDGYTPSVGDNFTVGTYASTSGSFGAIDLAETPTVAYTANVGASTLVLTSSAATLTTTKTAVTSSAPNGANYGQLVQYTATVTGQGGTPTGRVQFQIDGLNSGAPIALSNGQATLTIALPAGSHAIAAFYTSDNTTFANSDDSGTPLVQVVNTATVTPSTIELYYTTYSSPSSVDKVSVSIGQGTATLGTPVPIVQNIPADGLIFLPNGDLMTAAGDLSEVNPNTGAVTTESQNVSGDHLALDPSGKVVWTSPQPGTLYEVPIAPLGPGIAVTLTGDEAQQGITHIAFDNSGQAFYVSSGAGGNGSFGLISLPKIGVTNPPPTAATQRIYSNLPAAHGITFDPFTGDLFLVGASSVAQIDPNTLKIVSELKFPGGFQFDQGAEDGKGHLYAADNGGHLLIVDYSATGLIGDPRNFVATPFLANALDDVAPLSGLGGAGIPITVTHTLPATGYNVNPTSITPNPASFSSTNVTWNTTFTPGQAETDQFQLTGQATNMQPGEVRQISSGTTVTATVTAQDGTQIPVSITLPPLTVAAQHIIELAPPTETADQGAAATYTVELSNPLPTDELYNLSVSGLATGENATIAASVPVPAGKTVNVPLSISVPLGAMQGTEAFLVSTTTAAGASDSVEGQLTVTGSVTTNALAVTTALSPAKAVAGQTNPGIYTVTITNTGDATDTYTLSASGLPAGFTATFSQTAITVPPGISNFRDVQLAITPPAGAVAADYPFTVKATSNTDSAVSSQTGGTMTVLAQGVQVQLTPSSAVPGSTYQLKVTNTGQATDTFNLSLASPGALVSTLGTNQVTLQPGASQTVPVTTTAVNFADQGTLPLTGIATSQTNASVQGQSTADLAVPSTQSMAATFNPAQQTLALPGTTSFLLQVNNTGNTEDSYSATIVGTTGPITANLIGLDGQPTQSVPLFILPGLTGGAILLDVNQTGTAQGTVTVLVQSLSNSSVKSAPTATVNVGAAVTTGATLNLTNNTGLALAEGSSAVLSNVKLQTSDSDRSVTPGSITYTITAVPTQGTLSVDGQPIAVGGTFTQQDINDGIVAYKANEEGADSFSFSVAAGGAPSISGSFLIAVSDPAIVPTGGFTLSASEGESSSVQTVATFTDPGGFEPQASYTAQIDWGDGSSSAGNITLPVAGQTATVNGQHSYCEEGTYTVRVTLHHEGATNATVTSTAVASDVALAASGGFIYSATAGAAASAQTVAVFTDPGGPEALADYSAQVDWGDGSVAAAGSISVDPTTHIFTVAGQHAYSADGTYPVKVTLHHDAMPDTTVKSTAQIGTVSSSGGSAIAATGVAVTGHEHSTLTSVTVATFTAGDGSTPASDFSATIDWGDGVTSAGSVSLSSGNAGTASYTVAGSHEYLDEGTFTIHVTITNLLIVGPAGSSATVSATATMHEELLAEGTLGTANQRYIDEIYRDAFSRNAEPTGREVWVGLLTQGASREAVAYEMLVHATSEEFQKETVAALYEQYLHRSPDSGGMQTWVAYLYGGGTIEGMTLGLLGSPEYWQVRGGGTAGGFLKAVFQDALGRPIDNPALGFFEGLMSKGVSAGQVAAAILSSDEYRDVRVEAIYEQFLDRPAMPTELATHAAELAQGIRDEQVMAELISSDEYFAKAQL